MKALVPVSDPPVAKPPINERATETEWRLLSSALQVFEFPKRPLGLALTQTISRPRTQQRLGQGKIVAASTRRIDGLVEELTMGMVACAYDDFIAAIPPKDWSGHLAGLVGSHVEPVPGAIDGQGRVIKQLDRMVLTTMSSRLLHRDLWLFKHLDMTKNETIQYNDDSARVRWRVYHSDNGTVDQDIGYVDFRRMGDQTLVTFRSAHRFTKAYRRGWGWAWVIGWQLRSTFAAHIANYRAVVAGQRKPGSPVEPG